MAFTQIPFEYFSDEKVNAVSRSARFLDLEGKGWCNEHRTDGALPSSMLARITDAGDPQADAEELVTAGLWTVTDAGWQLDWHGQQSAAQAAEKKEANRARQENYQRRTKLHGAGDHSMCVPKYCKEVRHNAVSNGVSNGVTNTPPSPVHPSPVPKGKDWDDWAARRASTSGADAPTAGRAARGEGKTAGVRSYAGAHGGTIFEGVNS